MKLLWQKLLIRIRYIKIQQLLTINNHIVFSLVLTVVQPPSVWGYERERGVPGRTIMLLLRRWDETLAGKTQGKTILMHGASLQLELFLVFSRCPCREPLKQPRLISACVCLCVRSFPKCAPFLKLCDGWSKTSGGLFCFVSHARFARGSG